MPKFGLVMKGIPVRNMGTPRAATPADSFAVRSLSELTGGEEMRQEAHRHNFFYLLITARGAGEHIIDFTAYPVGNYTLFFMRPGQVHQLRLEADSTGYMIQFERQFYFLQEKGFEHLLQKAASVNYYPLQEGLFREVYTLVTAVFEEAAHGREGYREVILAHLSILFARLIRQAAVRYEGSGNLYIQQRMQEFEALLEKYAPFNKPVAAYAAMMHLSIYQLNAIVKQMQGKTASQVISDYVVLEAKRRLLCTGETVARIATALGFEDASYFIRFFKRHTGIAPEAFRRKCR
ncbi:AraC family transcriptional regulator [Filimonas zeae]|uniref:AraC family transcriptional regulator n=2 Tax=Filimonas zeae TaxID=1737353 RepID=A0A917ITH2_9BACT|nr:AraC family transcriptional regulator [Filimonas zeae]